MSITTTTLTEDAHAERWRLWQLAYAESSRRTEVRARIVFAIIMTALAAWLGFQAMSSSLGA